MVTIETPLAEELAGFQDPDDRFFALIRNDNDLDPAFLDVKYQIRRVALGEDDLILLELRYRFAHPDFFEKVLWVERLPARLSCHVVIRREDSLRFLLPASRER